MNFKRWLEVSQMDPYEAMGVLGLDDFAGKVLTKDVLDRIYRQKAMEWHPDRNADKPEATKMFQQIQAAFEKLEEYIGQELPGASMPSGTASVPRRYRPVEETAKNYSEDQIREFAQRIEELGYFQFSMRHKTEMLPMDLGDFAYRAIGSADFTRSLKKYNKDSAEEIFTLIKEAMEMDKATFPTSIVTATINEKWNEGWITYHYPLSAGNIETRSMFGYSEKFGYRSMSFKAAAKRKTSAGKLGKNSREVRVAVETYLHQNGLQRLRSGGRDVYYGTPANQGARTVEGSMIKLQPKAFKMVKRSRSGGKMFESNIKSFAYSHLTNEILDMAINWVKVRSQGPE